MERVVGEDRGNSTSIRQVVASSFIGTTIEWYDFLLYGTAAALVFNQLFFPSFDPLVGSLLAFATFGVGFFARPLGGIVFGHFGDKIGRKSMLVLTMLIMGVATFLVGLLPTYEAIGIWAPVLLVALRFLQGFAVGGEWGGAVLMTIEHSRPDRRGFNGSWPQMGAPTGLMLSTVVFALFAMLPEDQFLSWGWRIPFLLSIVLIGVGLFIRLRIMETPAFAKVKETRTEAPAPIIQVFRDHPKNVLLAAGSGLAAHGMLYLLTVFVLSYATTELGLPRNVVLTGVVIATAISLVTIPAYGALSDRIGRRPVYMGGALALLLFAFPFYWLVDTGSVVLLWLAFVLGVSVFHSAIFGPQAAFFSELFGTSTRYTGASLGYQLSSVLGGGLAPFIATALLAASGGLTLVALYSAGLALISLVSVYLATETYKTDILEERQTTGEGRSAVMDRGSSAGSL